MLPMKKKNRYEKQINHPGRKQTLQQLDYYCTAAAPPSKANLSSHLSMYLIVNKLCGFVDI
jgi:hypothetical protein